MPLQALLQVPESLRVPAVLPGRGIRSKQCVARFGCWLDRRRLYLRNGKTEEDLTEALASLPSGLAHSRNLHAADVYPVRRPPCPHEHSNAVISFLFSQIEMLVLVSACPRSFRTQMDTCLDAYPSSSCFQTPTPPAPISELDPRP